MARSEIIRTPVDARFNALYGKRAASDAPEVPAQAAQAPAAPVPVNNRVLTVPGAGFAPATPYNCNNIMRFAQDSYLSFN